MDDQTPDSPPSVKWRYCDCSCHRSEHIQHMMACCDGQCPHCGHWIIGFDEHIRDQHPSALAEEMMCGGGETPPEQPPQSMTA